MFYSVCDTCVSVKPYLLIIVLFSVEKFYFYKSLLCRHLNVKCVLCNTVEWHCSYWVRAAVLNIKITHEKIVEYYVSQNIYILYNIGIQLPMRYDIFVSQNFKCSLVRGLIIRAWGICLSDELFQKEVGFMKDLLQCNGYPHNFIRKQDSCIINKVN